MNKKKIQLGLEFIIILALALYAFLHFSAKTPIVTPDQPTQTQTENTAVAYFCEEGTFTATYAKDSVVLTLPNNRVLTLPQTISASGTRYEEGKTSFVTKGNNAFLDEGKAAPTYSNCVAGEETADGAMRTFTDRTQLFSFSHSTDFTLSGGESGYSQSWRQGTQDLGLTLVKARLPQTFDPQTNFGDATFTVGTSSDPSAVAKCLTEGNGNDSKSTQVTINGITFSKLSFGDAGAGNYYDTTSYRTVRNNQCYAIEYTIHSANIGNFSPDQNIMPFHKEKIQGLLEGIVQSFRFLTN